MLPPGEFIALAEVSGIIQPLTRWVMRAAVPVSYTHLRAHETRGNLVCRLLLEKKKKKKKKQNKNHLFYLFFF